MEEGSPRQRGLPRQGSGSPKRTQEQVLYGIGPPRQAILRLRKPEKSYYRLMGDFCGQFKSRFGVACVGFFMGIIIYGIIGLKD